MLRIAKLLPLLVIFLLAGSAHAADVYLAQATAGGGTGADCADARTVAGATWTAGNNYHLCGTITSAVTPGASGTSGSKITIIFETGAKISMPACPTDSGSGGGCLNLANKSWIVVDGGTGNNGIIESTANGTSLANHVNSVGVAVDSGSNLEIKNLTIRNLFVNVCCTDGSQFGQGTYAQGGLTNIRFHDNICTQEFACVQWQTTSTSSNLEADHNSLPSQDVGWGIVIVMGDIGFQVNGVFIHDNDITPGSGTGRTGSSPTYTGTNSWCTGGSDLTHLDPIHTWSQGSSPAGMFDDEIYNNKIHGYFCVNGTTANSTAAIFWEAHVSGGNAPNTATVYNNLILMTGGHPGDGAIYSQSGTNGNIYNNTIDCTGADSSGIGMELGGGTNVIKNNIVEHCPNNGFLNDGGSVTGSNNLCFSNGATGGGGTSCIGTSQVTTNPNLDVNYVPTAGSPAISAGANLTSVGLTPLDSSKPLLIGPGNDSATGVARPSVAAWDIGAYQFSAVPSVSFSPISLTLATTVVGHTSPSQSTTLTNTGGATLTISSVSLTGANTGDFGLTNGCAGTLAAGANCILSITFTPTLAAARSASISVSDNASGSPHTVPLSGTGVSAIPLPVVKSPIIMGMLAQ